MLSARQALRTLTEAVVSTAAASGTSVAGIRGIAFHDLRRDDLIAGHPSFEVAVDEVSQLPLVQARFGRNEGRRLVLQFVYEVLKKLEQPLFSESAFDGTWNAFTTELRNPDWTYRAVGNMRSFRYDKPHVPLGDGVTISGRDFDALERLGFGAGVLAHLSEDWSGFGASSFVVIVEQRVKKAPENVVMGADDSLWLNAQRTLGALRLLGPGDVAMGPMWVVRVAAFTVGLGGSQIGLAIPSIGSEYVLTDEIVAAVPRLYAELQSLEQVAYAQAPGNLGLALRSFMATYDRWPPGNDSRLIDSVTALEAVLGTEAEISFKLAFRVASLLAGSDAERSAVFDELKAFYETRSRLVHGGELKKKHQEILNNVDALRGRVRRLLRSFVLLSVRGPGKYSKKFFREDIDGALLNASEREELRHAMELDQTSTG
jgi:hypothetical protein